VVVTGAVHAAGCPYTGEITDPVSVVMVAIRNRYNGGRPSVTVSTRFCRSIPVNDTGGSVTGEEPPAAVSDPV